MNNKENTTQPSPLPFQLKTERFLFSIARKFVYITPAEIDNEINTCLESLIAFTLADRGYIYFFKQNNTQLEAAYMVKPKNIPNKIPRHSQVNGPDFAWLSDSILNNSAVVVANPQVLPPKAATIKMIMEAEKSKSMLLCPFIANDIVVGFIGIDTVSGELHHFKELEHLLRGSADIFNGAIERKKAVQAGIRIEQKMRSLFREIADVVFISTPEGKLLEINPAGAKLFGFSSVKELLNIHNVSNFYMNARDRVKFKKTLEQNGSIKDYELTLRRKNGEKIIVLETVTAVRDTNGEITSYEGIMRDITDKRQLEQQLFQAQKMESIGLLAGGIAHDFNNILTALIGYAQLILMEGGEDQPYYKNVQNIIRSGKRAEDLIRKLLAFSRKQMIELKTSDINQIITELHSMLSRLLPEDIEFTLDLKGEKNLIKADDVQIQQILVNLIVNAGHAINALGNKSKAKSIVIHTERTKIDDDFTTLHPGSRKGNYILLSVSDTGIGMDEKTKSKIFEPFFTTKKDTGGSGLGLSTIYGIVKQNKGYITVESEPGKGAEFKVYWPATTEDKRKTTVPDSDLTDKERTETILFVEDDEDVRALACTGLKTLGYNVIEARHGAHALKIVKRKNLSDKIDLVITDMIMPEMGGEALALKLREINPHIKILLCSGYTDSRIFMLESEGIEGYSFLAKPYTINKLEKKIQTILHKSD